MIEYLENGNLLPKIILGTLFNRRRPGWIVLLGHDTREAYDTIAQVLFDMRLLYRRTTKPHMSQLKDMTTILHDPDSGPNSGMLLRGISADLIIIDDPEVVESRDHVAIAHLERPDGTLIKIGKKI